MNKIMDEGMTPDPDWRDSVQGIVNMGFFLRRMKENFTRKEVLRIALADYGIQESAVDRIIRIAENKFIADPANADKLPAAWGRLHELRLLPEDIFQEKLKINGLKDITKYEIWKLRGVKRKGYEQRKESGRHAGAKVHFPAGVSLLEHIRRGMEIEAKEKITSEEVAERLDIYTQTYRMIRTLIQLSERPELTDHDREFVKDLLAKIEKTRNVRSYYREARPLIERVWGDAQSAIKNDRGMQKRVDSFRTSIIILYDTCQRIVELEVPYMSDEDVNKSINELTESGKIIRKLAEKLRRSKDG